MGVGGVPGSGEKTVCENRQKVGLRYFCGFYSCNAYAMLVPRLPCKHNTVNSGI